MGLFLIIAVIVLALDHISKALIINNMTLGQEVEIIKDFFSLTYVKNDGVAFSIQLPLFVMIIISVIALVAILFVVIKNKYKAKGNALVIIALAFIFGGALGNFLDRIFQEGNLVIDFLAFTLYYPSFSGGFHFASFNFAIFNIADSFIVVGAILLMIYFLFVEGKKKHAN